MTGTEETLDLNDSLDVTATHQMTTAISDTERITALVRSGRTVPVLQRDIINTCIGRIRLNGLYAVFRKTNAIQRNSISMDLSSHKRYNCYCYKLKKNYLF